ncbi:unnamed protein product [Effrenium voratum]|nr:unnamed protein product [Effrenium voratum]
MEAGSETLLVAHFGITHALAALALLVVWLCWSWRRAPARGKERSEHSQLRVSREEDLELTAAQAKLQQCDQELKLARKRAAEAEAQLELQEAELRQLRQREAEFQETRKHMALLEAQWRDTEGALEEASDVMRLNCELQAKLELCEKQLRLVRPRSCRRMPVMPMPAEGSPGPLVQACSLCAAPAPMAPQGPALCLVCQEMTDATRQEDMQLEVAAGSEGSCSRSSSIYSAHPRGRTLRRPGSPEMPLSYWWRPHTSSPPPGPRPCLRCSSS